MSQADVESSTDRLSLQDVRNKQPRPLEPSDLAFADTDPRRLYFVVGVLPDDELEALSVKQMHDKTFRYEEWSDIPDAIASRRLIPKRVDRQRLTALPPEWVDHIDLDEVRR